MVPPMHKRMHQWAYEQQRQQYECPRPMLPKDNANEDNNSNYDQSQQ